MTGRNTFDKENPKHIKWLRKRIFELHVVYEKVNGAGTMGDVELSAVTARWAERLHGARGIVIQEVIQDHCKTENRFPHFSRLQMKVWAEHEKREIKEENFENLINHVKKD